MLTPVVATTVRRKLTPGVIAVGVFLFFGATMAALAGTTLVFPGTILDQAWALNPTAYRQLAPLGRIVGLLFSILVGSGIKNRTHTGAALMKPRLVPDLLTRTHRDHQTGTAKIIGRDTQRV